MTPVNITGLQQFIAILVLVIAVTVAVFRLTSMVRTVLTFLLLMLATAHYLVLLGVSSQVEVHLLPFIVVESKYVATTGRVESVFYLDMGQLSLLAAVLLWCREVKSTFNRWFKCARPSPRHEAR